MQATYKQATHKWVQSLWTGLTYLLVFLLVFPDRKSTRLNSSH